MEIRPNIDVGSVVFFSPDGHLGCARFGSSSGPWLLDINDVQIKSVP